MSAAADTIVAIATAPGQGALGILRLSGPRAWAAAARVARDWPRAPVPRRAWVSRFADAHGLLVDRGLVLLFQGPASATGEDVAELHAHGSRALLELLLQASLTEDGVRRAGPGEFTRRAYLNGRLDLAQAEAVAQLVAAESVTQVRAAAAQLEGALGLRLEALRRAVLALTAGLEGALDFPDEADEALPGLRGELEVALQLARALQGDLERGALLRRGARVVLYGPPNAGKSTLFNRLLGVERALVDEAPGTTRDALEGRLLLEGLPVTWVDTAGLRAGGGRLEAEGMRRTRRELLEADVAVLLLPATTTSQAEVAAWLAEAPAAVGLLAWSRADEVPAAAVPGQEGLRVSGLTGQGVEALRQAVLARLAVSAGAVALASEVHQELVGRALAALAAAQEAWDVSLEAAAGEVAVALEVLSAAQSRDVGRDRLDALFARFCIGK